MCRCEPVRTALQRFRRQSLTKTLPAHDCPLCRAAKTTAPAAAPTVSHHSDVSLQVVPQSGRRGGPTADRGGCAVRGERGASQALAWLGDRQAMMSAKREYSDADAGFVLSTLEPDQLAEAKRVALPRRRVGTAVGTAGECGVHDGCGVLAGVDGGALVISPSMRGSKRSHVWMFFGAEAPRDDFPGCTKSENARSQRRPR